MESFLATVVGAPVLLVLMLVVRGIAGWLFNPIDEIDWMLASILSALIPIGLCLFSYGIGATILGLW